MRLTLVDTGALLGLMVGRDQHHAEARALFRSLPPNARVVIPSSVMLELYRLILYRSNDPRYTLDIYDKLRAVYPVEHPLPADHEMARGLLARFGDQTITLADAVLATMAERLGARVLTLDRRHFGLMGTEPVRV